MSQVCIETSLSDLQGIAKEIIGQAFTEAFTKYEELQTLKQEVNDLNNRFQVLQEIMPIHPRDFRMQVRQKIIALKNDEKMTFHQIADFLNSRGIRTLSGKGKWHIGTISKLYSQKNTS